MRNGVLYSSLKTRPFKQDDFMDKKINYLQNIPFLGV